MRKSFYKNIILLIMMQLSAISSVVLIAQGFLPIKLGIPQWCIIETGIVLVWLFCILDRLSVFKKALISNFIFAIVVWLSRKIVSGGLAGICHAYVEKINLYYNTSFYFAYGRQNNISTVYAFLVVFTILEFSLIYLVRRRLRVYIVWPVSLIILGFLVGFAPTALGMVMVFEMICFIVSDIVNTESKRGVRIAIVSVLIVLVSGLLAQAFSQQIIKTGSKVKKFQYSLERSINGYFNRFDIGKGIIDNRAPEYSEKEVFKISSSLKTNGSLYLKGFVAGEFINSSWVNDGESVEKECREAGYEFDELQKILANTLFENETENRNYAEYEIEYTDKFTSNLYLPYGTKIPIDEAGVKDDILLKKGWFTRKIQAVGVRQNSSFERMLSADKNDSEVIKWYSRYVRKYAKKSNCDYVENAIDDFEEGYYVSENWKNNAFRYDMAKQISRYLDRYYRYSLELDSVEGNVIDYFLNESHEGFCVHFATAGALMLKEYGVPCRYVSGYIVKEKDFEKSEDGKYIASVKDSAAHAWVEIYLDGIGWIPIEMTPGYSKFEQDEFDYYDYENESEIDTINSEEDIESETQAGSVETEETEVIVEDVKESNDAQIVEKNNNSQSGQNKYEVNNAGQKNKWVLITLIICVFVSSIIVIFRVRHKGKRREIKIRTRANLLKRHRLLYKKQRIRIKSDSMLEQHLVKTYSDINEEDWKEYMRIIKKARFSKENLSVDEYNKCSDIYTKIGLQ